MEKMRRLPLGADVMSEGFVYFIQSEMAGQPIKIGYTKNIESRLKQLQTGHPASLALLGQLPGPQSLETSLHKTFAADRLYGEWFKPSAPLLALAKDAAPERGPKELAHRQHLLVKKTQRQLSDRISHARYCRKINRFLCEWRGAAVGHIVIPAPDSNSGLDPRFHSAYTLSLIHISEPTRPY